MQVASLKSLLTDKKYIRDLVNGTLKSDPRVQKIKGLFSYLYDLAPNCFQISTEVNAKISSDPSILNNKEIKLKIKHNDFDFSILNESKIQSIENQFENFLCHPDKDLNYSPEVKIKEISALNDDISKKIILSDVSNFISKSCSECHDSESDWFPKGEDFKNIKQFINYRSSAGFSVLDHLKGKNKASVMPPQGSILDETLTKNSKKEIIQLLESKDFKKTYLP